MKRIFSLILSFSFALFEIFCALKLDKILRGLVYVFFLTFIFGPPLYKKLPLRMRILLRWKTWKRLGKMVE
jgi:hypothetical protein